MKYPLFDTIVAPATPQGQSAIAIIRLSGTEAIDVASKIFKGTTLQDKPSHTIHYGWIVDGEREIDEVMVSLFQAPRSFTTEDSVEISCHGSPQIVNHIINTAIKNGARLANPGEFTLRAFLNGRLDLSQAEAVADLIHSTSSKSSEIALNQLKGHLSGRLKELRQELIDFAALMELELDFGEEDVEFANRDNLKELIHKILRTTQPLLDSFRWGNSIKEGIPIAIVGPPNAGKSTFLNTILNEDKALVSDIAGTTRDIIEDILVIEGIAFRFIDTAGIRETSDKLEGLGIEKSRQKLKEADIVFYLNDINMSAEDIWKDFKNLEVPAEKNTVILLNKSDKVDSKNIATKTAEMEQISGIPVFAISAKHENTLDSIWDYLKKYVYQFNVEEGTVISNARHAEALQNTQLSLQKVLDNLDTGISSDFIALDIRQALYHLGSITGEVSSDDLLDSIFSRFCIGK